MDDFAHHPTAVRETIAAVKAAFPGRRIIAVFEPRTNSSMRKVFQPVYPDSFEGADKVCIRQPRLDKVPEAERFSSEELVAASSTAAAKRRASSPTPIRSLTISRRPPPPAT